MTNWAQWHNNNSALHVHGTPYIMDWQQFKGRMKVQASLKILPQSPGA